MNSPHRAVLTPCTGVCQLAGDGLCDGCYRNTDEIAGWSMMDDGERMRLMEEVLPDREIRRRL